LYLPALFFTSSSLLALEISLMRVLRVEGFGNFTFSAIALALTGFGAGGTLVFLLKKYFLKKERSASLFTSATFLFTLGLGYYISGYISFDPLRLVWDINQLFRLLLRFFIYTVPFISGSIFIVLAFLIEKPGKVYFFNMSGSAFGVAVILISMYFIAPDRIFIIPLSLSLIAVILLSISLRPGYKRLLVLVVLILSGFIFFLNAGINIIPYKGIKLTLNLPGAKIIEQKMSPFGTLEVVSSNMIRSASGLSLSFEETLPEQHGLFLDGDTFSAIDRIKTLQSIHYLYYQPQSAVYSIYKSPDVFIIGLGGGIGVERAYINKSRNITVTEENPHIPNLLQNRFSDYNNAFFNKSNISVIKSNGRDFISRTDSRWDIIEISGTDSMVSSIGGIYSTDTNYTLTVEAFHDYLGRLNTNGSVSVTVGLKNPPRNLLKLVNLAKRTLIEQGLDPIECITVIRGWSTGTVILKKRPFTRRETEKIKAFCERMFFDVVYYPGIDPREANRYNVVDRALFFNGVSGILNDDRYVKDYVFNLVHPTDNRPYFSYFFKITKLPFHLKEMGHKLILVIEGGYIILFSTFVTAVVYSFILIVIPLFFAGNKIQPKKAKVLIYFALLGISFMLIEIVLITKVSKYLANPLYSSSAIITSLLIFSGTGSYVSDILVKKSKRITWKYTAHFSILFIAGYTLIVLFFYDRFYDSLANIPLLFKLTVSILLILPLGLCMGIPFPSGISELKKTNDHSIPWAWSINGYFSVIASTGAVLISTNVGLVLTGVAAAAGYLCALLVFPE
jgi:hypothetical protein